ncbi:tRNA 2-selenouridine(34) synthase MnmH [Adhaeribacter rhizoryzae]|uniref:tRNA 2-selenouridine(34) synthase MnmH n=1 Tax=Adhaeribacter rhizoryzae TaxID=2607907 RepID=A0A5M6DD34_9BACT|nr:tRNA 2-selenouridine(34) synthase MnmH [Adhaeribacter rhizoryzae]KAA5543979.1 tRNA 2-selenouridine(34) synthase MnmH [Adhaeribacter rhizoryzae]
MINKLTTEQFLEKAASLPVLDVRAPLEFTAGHIPGAISFPLFTDAERKQVGTAYKQISRDKAILIGLDYFGPKMSGFVKLATKLAPQKEVLLHCWRGGMRSNGVAWLLDLAGFTVNLLEHGYKDYRHFALAQFEKKYPLVILGGMTGSGKTEILHQLQQASESIIDLENLAHHKGSSFGLIGQPPQTTTEQFENDFALALYGQNIRQPKRLWLEDEGISIGKVNIPKPFYEQMQAATLIKIEVPKIERIRKLAREYCQADKALLTEAILRIKKRLGGLATKEALQAIETDDMEKMVELALVYYDKAYSYQLANKNPQQIITIPLPTTNAAENTQQILEVLQRKQTAIKTTSQPD